MTGRVLAGIALRVWGVVFVIDALVAAPQTATLLLMPFETDASSRAIVYANQVSVALSLGANLLVGVALIALAGRIAAVVIPETDPLVLHVDAAGLTVIAFAVTGLVILLWGIKDLAAVAYAGLTKPGFIGSETWLSYEWRQERDLIVRAIVEVTAGALLLLGRAGVANAWRSVRRPTASASADAGDVE